ncbi:MAG: arsenic efflux protein [Clostridia bacterium]|nr:arsenic efflux protein [Clostridia bacterium]
MLNTIFHVIWHAIKDSVITLPILFISYLLIELLEDKILNKYQKNKKINSLFSPVVSAGFGLIPQCGFSVVATDLFSKKAITIGSLFAILLATSDEAVPLMLSNPANYGYLALIVGIKFIYAVLVGVLIDSCFKALKNKTQTQNLKSKTNHKQEDLTTGKNSVEVKDDHTHDDLDHNHCDGEEHDHTHGKMIEDVAVYGCCKHDLQKGKGKLKDIFIHPLLHSLKIFGLIFLINIVFGLLIELVGENSIANFMSSTGFFQPFLVALVGLIPNCAVSVIVTELFLLGGISLGACISGLCINSGIALIVLFKLNKNVKQNLAILFSLYGLSCAIGIIVNLF